MSIAQETIRFTVPLFSWNCIDDQTKIRLGNFLALDQKKTQYYFDLYFSKFHVLHKIGHLITHLYDDDHENKLGRTEFCANLFAYKYLVNKKEQEYINTIPEVFKYIITKNNLQPEIHKEYLDEYFIGMKKDLIGYILVHAQLFLDCLNNKMELREVMECISKHNLVELNSSVILQKNISEKMLIQEILAYIFEMNKIEVSIEFEEQKKLTSQSLDLQCY